ncbi:MAG: thioesterase family protein [Blastocatellia bacterium]|nr:thioesterase family protein [Blastocatellia bacterium]
MNLFLRMLLVVTTALLSREKLDPLGESAVTFRVLPNDLDINAHMNNGRYLTLMDLGRIDLIVRTGLGRVVRQQGWRPLVGSVLTQYKRSLNPFETYQLKTKVLCWDEKWIFLEQRFERNGKTAALGIVKTLFRHPRQGNVPPYEVMQAMGVGLNSPEIPLAVQLWQDAEGFLIPASAGKGPGGFRLALCSTPHCDNEIHDPSETGHFCSECALEQDLFEREFRWGGLATIAK